MNSAPVNNAISLQKCASYGKELSAAVEELIDKLGGMSRFVGTGHKALIKPNLLTDREPEKAVTTHPELVRVIIRLVKKAGGHPEVADSSASAVKTEDVWQATGIQRVCDEERVPLVNLEKCGSVNFNDDGYRYSIAKPVLECDLLINVPKVKTHVLTTLTAAIKNLYGAIPGYQKAMLHKSHPTAKDFGMLLACIYRRLKPSLNIADAIWAMEGEGPSGGSRTDLNFLAASADALAMDAMLCNILRINPRTVPYIVHLSRDTTLANAAKYTITGCAIDEIRPKSFAKPGAAKARLIPGFLVKILGPYIWIRPSIGTKCRLCGRCVECCPVKALSIEDNATKPTLDACKCIGCCCCHEVCPFDAVKITQSPLLNIVRKGKLP